MNKVQVVGLGYIGLPTAVIIADHGIDVVGLDVSQRIVDTINRGEIHVIESDIEKAAHRVVKEGKLRATLSAEDADVFIIAVPTPFTDGHLPDVTFLKAAVKSIAPSLRKGNIVILESTLPVGTTNDMCAYMKKLRPDLSFPDAAGDQADIRVAHCPERVLPGHVMRELIENDRVIGGISAACAKAAKAFYGIFVKGKCVVTNARTAEMTKLTENSYRDVNIAFANELSIICGKLGVNVWELIELANLHPRVNILQPGPGVGGHCIAVDPWFIVSSAPQEARLIRAAREVNDSKPLYIIQQVKVAAAKVKSPVIACLGLSYKADIDDLRESPAVDIVKHLAEDDTGFLLVVEPHIKELPRALADLKNIEKTTLDDAIGRAHIVLLLVNHKVFINLDRAKLAGKTVIDTRGIWRTA
ncbi:MAG: UDP-N-acetyl-D-mannosamine dehydrogenase [Nitrospinae bacterium]|nr:UDP-N-acetyl-D-mannosamine dehydrogenase [Nitrospinota bacterium]